MHKIRSISVEEDLDKSSLGSKAARKNRRPEYNEPFRSVLPGKFERYLVGLSNTIIQPTIPGLKSRGSHSRFDGLLLANSDRALVCFLVSLAYLLLDSSESAIVISTDKMSLSSFDPGCRGF